MQEDPTIFLHATHICKQVKSGDSLITILSDINLSVKRGESVAILGASGSGKTTLLTLLAGLDVPTSGDICFQKEHLARLDEEARAAIRRQHVGFIFQSFQLLPALTALENVMLPLEIQYMPNREATEKAIHWLTQAGLRERLHHYPLTLSGGEQQRVAIARAFVTAPTVIFADEMTGNLDTQTGKHITDLLFKLNHEHHTTLVLVTHDDELANRCQRRLLLKEGILHAC